MTRKKHWDENCFNLRPGPILAASTRSLLRGRAKIGPDTKFLTPVLLRPDFGRNADCSLEQCHTIWPGLLEAWLVLTSVKYHGNLYILIPLNQRLALTRLRATGP